MCMDYRKFKNATKRDHFSLPFIMKCWSTWQIILCFVFLIGIRDIIKSQSFLMTKAKPLLLVPIELMLISGCPSNYAMHQLHSKDAYCLYFLI
jgi:hypothetical protein